MPGDSITERVQKHKPLFNRIADAISQLDVDIVCLQEVAEAETEPITDPYGQAPSNAARRINKRLNDERGYQIRQDWSHFAWDTWREGLAILSKHPICKSRSRYVTANQSKNWWKSRNILFAQIEHPSDGLLNIFSVHTGWWDDEEEPAQPQFERLRTWANAEHTPDVAATLLCGDFNTSAGTPGYIYWTNRGDYHDQYLLANPEGMYDPTIADHADGWQPGSSGQRLDYIFLKHGSSLVIQEATILFTDSDFGRVSDHAGVFASFRPVD